MLFYVLTDDVEWAEENLINLDEHIYYAGSKETNTIDGLSLSNRDQIGNFFNFFSKMIFLMHIFFKPKPVFPFVNKCVNRIIQIT